MVLLNLYSISEPWTRFLPLGASSVKAFLMSRASQFQIKLSPRSTKTMRRVWFYSHMKQAANRAEISSLSGTLGSLCESRFRRRRKSKWNCGGTSDTHRRHRRLDFFSSLCSAALLISTESSAQVLSMPFGIQKCLPICGLERNSIGSGTWPGGSIVTSIERSLEKLTMDIKVSLS